MINEMQLLNKEMKGEMNINWINGADQWMATKEDHVIYQSDKYQKQVSKI